MKLICPRCQQKLEAPPEMYGQVTNCPACAEVLQIPADRKSSQTMDKIQNDDLHCFSCPNCNQKLRIQDENVKKAKCPKCKQVFKLSFGGPIDKEPSQAVDKKCKAKIVPDNCEPGLA